GMNVMVALTVSCLVIILRDDFDASVLKEPADQKELFDNTVDDRIASIHLSSTDSDLEDDVLDAVNQLISQGANRIVISLNEPNLVEHENKVKNIILRKYPRHLLGAVPILISHELSDDNDDARRTWGGLIN